MNKDKYHGVAAVFSLVLLALMACSPIEQSGKGDTVKLKKYRIKYIQERDEPKYKLSEWNGNVLIYYKSDGSAFGKYCFEGAGNGIIPYDSLFEVGLKDDKEKLVYERKDDVLKGYSTSGVLTITFDNKGRIKQRKYEEEGKQPSITKYTYQGNGPAIASHILDRDFLNGAYQFDMANVLHNKYKKQYEWQKLRGSQDKMS